MIPYTSMIDEIAERRFSTRTDDGWLLQAEILAKGSRPIVALLLHAIMANRRSMDRPTGQGLGSTLANAGLTVVSADLRGHGESGPSASDGAQYTYDDYILFDIPAVFTLVRNLFPDHRIIVVGHSLGAHTILAASGMFPHVNPDGIVSIAANMWLPSDEPSPLRRAAKSALLRALLVISKRRGYFDPKPFRLGTIPLSIAFVRQFWAIWSSDRYTSMDGKHDYTEALAKARCPVLGVASYGDTLLAHPDAASRFFERIGSPNKTMRIVKPAELGGKAPTHMGLTTDPSSRPIWNEIAEWMLRLD